MNASMMDSNINRKLIFGILFLAQYTFGQSAMGGWTLHVPALQSSAVVANGNLIYAAFDNGLLEYDWEANEKSLLTSTNSLSDVRITALGLEPLSKTMVVGYENGNVDLFANNTFFNLPAIKLAQIQGIKTIQRIECYQGKIYLATGFGIVVVDPIKQEVRDTYYPTAIKTVINDIAFSGDTIFALTNDHLRWAKMNNPALGDFNQWTVDTRVPIDVNEGYQEIERINNNLVLLKISPTYGNDSVFVVQSSGLQAIDILGFDLEMNSIANHNNQLAVNVDGGIFVMKTDYSGVTYSRNSYEVGEFPDVNASISVDGNLYLADNKAGLVVIDAFGAYEKIRFQGPPKRDFFSVDWEAGKLICAGGGIAGIAVTYNQSGFYLLEDQEWSLYAKENVPLWDTLNVYDFLATSINPKNPDEFAYATYSQVPVGIVSKDRTTSQAFTPSNSPIEYTFLGNGQGFVSDVRYDDKGNLWMINAYCDQTLKVLKENKEWVTFDMGNASKNGFTGDVVIDYNNNVWFSVDGRGVFGLNYNETLDNLADDKKIQFQKGEGLGNLPTNSVRALAVDFDNEIWVGTDAGFAIIYSSDGAFDAEAGDFDAQRIKLDFEGNVEYLLGSTVINDIEVDGGNRKWFATEGTGIFLLSPDGLTILENYTAENSPLISNTVMDIEIDHNTGELYAVTDEGLISFRIDATYEDPEYADVKVFPNPVKPGFGGVITIQGIRYNSDVKVTDMGGNLVFQTSSNGGTAIWNGKNLDGTPVASGVYLIWTAANEGKGRKVGKVVVINE